MGCGSSKGQTVVPNDSVKEQTVHTEPRKQQKKKELDYDALSLASVATGKSMIFPDPKTVEVLKSTPPNKGKYIRMEDTFWSKKKKLVPDYSVMERIDAHVVKVSFCT